MGRKSEKYDIAFEAVRVSGKNRKNSFSEPRGFRSSLPSMTLDEVAVWKQEKKSRFSRRASTGSETSVSLFSNPPSRSATPDLPYIPGISNMAAHFPALK